MKGGKFKVFFKVSFLEILEQYGDSKEDKALKRFINYFIDELRKKGITYIPENMSFFKILKDKGKLNKKEMVKLIEAIFEKIGKKKLFQKRTVSRLNIYFKDLLLVYAASENSQVFQDISKNYFANFDFHRKFGNNALTIAQKWNESVQNIENHIAFSHLFDDEVISSSLSSFIDIFDIYPDFY